MIPLITLSSNRLTRRAIVSICAAALLSLVTAGLRAEERVDPRSGLLYSTTVDAVLAAGAIDVAIERSLDTRRSAPGLLGTRWRLSFDSRLSRLGELVMTDEGGVATLFTRAGSDAEYQSGTGERIVFEKDGRAVRRSADETRDTFDAQGRLVERRDRNGNTLALRYGSDGRLARVDGPHGTFVQFTTDTAGRATRAALSSGRSVAYVYANDLLTEVRVSDGSTLRYGYDAAGRLVRIEYPAAGAVEFAYDARGRVISRRWADGATERYQYDDAQNTVRQTDPAGAVTTTRWSADRRQGDITGPLGEKASIAFDESGRLIATTAPGGATSRIGYDAAGRVISTENPLGEIRRYEYVGATQRLQAVIRPDGTRETYAYDDRGNLATIRVGAETLLAMTYHADGTVASIRDHNAGLRKLIYNADGRLESSTAATGETTRFEYDARGNLIRTIDPAGAATVRTYDAQDRLAAITYPTGRTQRREYDPSGRLRRVVDSSAGETRYDYDARGRIASETDGYGRVTRNEYDARGSLKRRLLPDGRIESFERNAAANLVALTDARGRTVRLEYDAQGRLGREQDAAGAQRSYRYDAAGRVTSRQDGAGGSETLSYDAQGRLVSAVSASGAKLGYEYDALGRMTATTDALGQVTRMAFDAEGGLAEVRAPDGSIARYGYDAAGRLKSVRHPGGGEARYDYDTGGRIARTVDALGNEVRRTYDAAGRVAGVTDAKGQTIGFAYDAAGRVSEKRLPDGTRIGYQYDSRGRIARVDDGRFPIVYAYDASDRVSRIEYPAIKRSLGYEYDAAGMLSRFRDSENRSFEYAYDAAKRLSQIKIGDGATIGFGYDARGRLSTIRYPNGVAGKIEYDDDSRVTRLVYTDASGKALGDWRHSYDAAGNIVETVDLRGVSTRYRYDPAGQLAEQIDGAAAMRYRYLPGGNRASREGKGAKVEYRYDAADRLLQAGDESFAYDANGNLTERRGPRGITRYTYDAENHLVNVKAADGSEVSYGYSPVGDRIWRRDAKGQTWFVTDGSNLLAELDERLAPKSAYVHGSAVDTPLIALRGGHQYYYHADRLGSVRLLTDEKGGVVAGYDYDAFGVPQTQLPGVENPFTFAGRELDLATGLYYNRARYYDAELGRFVSTDPAPAQMTDAIDLNPFLYARNNPLRFIDPLGLEYWGPKWGAIPETPEVLAKKLSIVNSSIDEARGAIERQQARIDAGEHVKPFTNRWGENITPGGDSEKALLKNLEDGLNEALSERQRLQGAIGRPTGNASTTLSGEAGPAAARPGQQTGAVRAPAAGRPATMQVARPGSAAAAADADAAAAAAAEAETLAGRAPTKGGGWGTAGGLAVGGAFLGANYYACREEGHSHQQCLAETAVGAGVGVGVGAGMSAAGITLPPAAVAILIGVGINLTANRLGNAPGVKAEAELQAELGRRFDDLFPKLKGAVEAKVAAVEALKQRLRSAGRGPHDSAVKANDFANAADSNIATLRGDLAKADGFCDIARTAILDLETLEGDFADRVKMLETGLDSAAGMVANCANPEEVTKAKNLYALGAGVVAEMTLRAQRVDRAQSLLKQARGAADQALAAADGRAQMIAGNAEVAASAAAAAQASDAPTKQEDNLDTAWAQATTLVDSFPSWFPPRQEVEEAVAGWRSRLNAARSGELVAGGDTAADLALADRAAAQAASRRDEATRLIGETRSAVDACAGAADGAVSSATAAATAGTTAGEGTLNRYSDLPQQADACLASLGPKTKNLIALHVRCPDKVAVNDTASCTAVGFYEDNPTNMVDMTAGDWPIGPSFTSSTPGPVTVRITRGNLSDAAIVTFEARPSDSQPTNLAGYDPRKDPGTGRTPPGNVAKAGQTGEGFGGGIPGSSVPPTDKSGLGGAPVTNQPQPATPVPTGPPGGNTGGPAAPQGVWCWSDQSQSYYLAPSYPCPPTKTLPSGLPPSAGQTPPSRPGSSIPGMPPPGSTLPGTIGSIGVITAPPRSPPMSPPQPGSTQPPPRGGTPGGRTAPPAPGVPPVAQGPGTTTPPPPSGGQCNQPLCYYKGQKDCEAGPLPDQDGWMSACSANMLLRCNQGEAGGTGSWCVHKGADPSCAVRAKRVCGERIQIQ